VLLVVFLALRVLVVSIWLLCVCLCNFFLFVCCLQSERFVFFFFLANFLSNQLQVSMVDSTWIFCYFFYFCCFVFDWCRNIPRVTTRIAVKV